VARGGPLKDVVQRLLRQARSTGIAPRLALLDRGFHQVEVVRYLQAARCPFVMPTVIRGHGPDHPAGPGGTRRFAAMRRSGWTDYTMTSRTHRSASVAICAVRRAGRGRKKAKRRRTYVYTCWGVSGHSCAWVWATYRKRFGIESSYRQMNEARARTSTRRPELRLLYVGLALVLRNEWVWLHSEALATPRRGGRVINEGRLRLKALLAWLREAVEGELGTVGEVATERKLCSQLVA
jgi:putative transposase